MKYLSIFALLFALGACSSDPKEKYKERQEEAKEEYEEALKEAEEEYREEQKEEAIDMIDDSDGVKVDDNNIEVDD